MTPPVQGADGVRLDTWLASLPLGAEPPFSYSRLGDGRSNLTYEVRDASDRCWVLRRPPTGQLVPSAHDVGREHRVLSALAATGAPVPRPLAICDDAATCDSPLVLMEFVEGTVIDSEEVGAGLAPTMRSRLGPSLMEALARIHAVDLKATELADLASHEPYAPRQLRRWRRQWDASRLRDIPLVGTIAERLEATAPAQTEVTLIHGDFHLGNVVVDPASGEVRAVLDWELCTLGDPRADLAGLLVYWQQEGEVFLPGPFAVTASPGFATHEQLVAAYEDASGRDLGDLAYWKALSCWKLAIILEGVRCRRLERSEPAGWIDAPVIDGLLERASTMADAAGL